MKNTAKSGKNTLKKTRAVKSAPNQRQTSTTKSAGGNTSARSILSWLYVGPATPESKLTSHGRGKKAT